MPWVSIEEATADEGWVWIRVKEPAPGSERVRAVKRDGQWRDAATDATVDAFQFFVPEPDDAYV